MWTYSAERQPFLYLAAALIAGKLFDGTVGPALSSIAIVVASGAALAVIFSRAGRDGAASVLLLLAVSAAGALLASVERRDLDRSRLKRLFEDNLIRGDDPVHLIGSLAVPPEPAPGAFHLDIHAESIIFRGQHSRATGGARLLAVVEDQASRAEFDRLGLDYGSRVQVLVRLERARSYSNPGSPNFNEFLERQGFDLTGVIKSPLLIEMLDKPAVTSPLGWLYRARLRAMEAIDARFEAEVAGTLKAMLFGNRYFLDPESADLMRESSTFHIISISGMHVALIAWALLGGWSHSRRRRTLHVIVVLIVLWLYALAVGLQPPVTRATVMISVGLFGPIVFRRAASVNTVSLAAFIMLALKPALAADPGFQLSFVAVAAIVALAVPLADRFSQIGRWQPSARTPHPPSCNQALKYMAELLFWNERRFRARMRRGYVQYGLDKVSATRSILLWIAQPILRWLVILLITSTMIQIATLPLSVLYFNRIAPVGIPINVLTGVLTAAMMLGAVASASLASLLPWLAAQIESVVTFAHYLLVNAAAPFTAIPGATFRAPHFEDWRAVIYIGYYALPGFMSILIERWRPVHIIEPGQRGRGSKAIRAFRVSLDPAAAAAVCGLGLALCLLAFARPAAPLSDGKLAVYFLDVGQGDAALVIFPRGATMLIDAGGEILFDKQEYGGEEIASEHRKKPARSFVGEMVVSRFLWSLGLTRIDYAVVTHADRDHIGGFSAVVRNFHIGQAVIGNAPLYENEFRNFAGLLSDRGIPVARVSAGESFQIQGVAVEVLWPPQSSHAQSWGSNDRSIVIRLVYGSVAILLTGDIERGGEDALLKMGYDLRADLLKVPHHGSKTSSSEPFLEAVRPRLAVVSVGERSRFGHPHETVVDRFLNRGITLYQTGRVGTVSARTDGFNLEIGTYTR